MIAQTIVRGGGPLEAHSIH
ncbi:hypothetical protein SPHV1_800008 [Novosphingobium sp. KN65.2]|nr:hypothetical protein SPHV1_800008 [Novosphingobium sp. KN65.2]